MTKKITAWPKKVVKLLLEAPDWLDDSGLRHMTKAKILSRIAILEQIYELKPHQFTKKKR